MSARVKSAGQRRAPGEARRLSREVCENRLRDVLGQVRVAIALPQRSGIDEIEVSPHQFTEGLFGSSLGVAPEQFGIGCHCQPIAPGPAKTAQEYLSKPQDSCGSIEVGARRGLRGGGEDSIRRRALPPRHRGERVLSMKHTNHAKGFQSTCGAFGMDCEFPQRPCREGETPASARWQFCSKIKSYDFSGGIAHFEQNELPLTVNIAQRHRR